jgi:hypothetical protein
MLNVGYIIPEDYANCNKYRCYEYNIKVNLTETDSEDEDWIPLTQDGVHWEVIDKAAWTQGIPAQVQYVSAFKRKPSIVVLIS